MKLLPYAFEITPTVGVNLPADMWGAQTLSIVGARMAFGIEPGHSIELGTLFQFSHNDHGYTLDINYRYEMSTELMDTFFVLGYHVTQFTLGVDYDASGACDPINCRTDSGTHKGIELGAGIQTPLTPMMPLRVGMRFLKKEPNLMLFLEVGLGLRF